MDALCYHTTLIKILMMMAVMRALKLQWRHNGHNSVSNHQPHHCLLNRLFRRRSKKTSKLRVTGLCVGNSPGTGEFPAQMASYAESVSIWWRHHEDKDQKITFLSQDLQGPPLTHDLTRWLMEIRGMRERFLQNKSLFQCTNYTILHISSIVVHYVVGNDFIEIRQALLWKISPSMP